ncbi:MAG: ComEC/Rec2 family competence protein [Chloroflexota bacterium]|nr:ComEC family competence protein [Dehalococcoidia bacterium]MDW8252762.1 ComEC/Rec2 family competence protein [Chloroflexota bacterium]
MAGAAGLPMGRAGVHGLDGGALPPAAAVGAVAAVVGAALASWAAVALVAGLLAAVGIGSLALPLRRQVVALVAIALLFLAAGHLRAQSARAVGHDDISRFNGQQTLVKGVVAELGDRRERFRRVVVDVFEAGSPLAPASGRMQVDLGPDEQVLPGEVVLLHGVVAAPPAFAGFDYRAVLERQGIRSTMRFPSLHQTGERAGAPIVGVLAAVREHLRASLSRSLPQPQAAIAAGLVIGGREELPAAVRDAFARTGTSHLLAVSGFNMMLVGAGALGVLLPLVGRRRAALGALVAIWLFAGVTTGTPAVLRAAVMASLGLVGLLFGRQRNGLLLLALASAALALVDPRVVDDVGFQLSVAATAGLLIAAGPIEAVLRRAALLRAEVLAPLREAAASTLAAVLATLPIVALTFATVSLVAVPVNVIVAPLIAPAMATAALCGLAGLLHPLLGHLTALPAWLFTSAILAAVEAAAAIPGAAVAVAPPPGWATLAVYLGLGAALFPPVRRAVGSVAAGARGRALLALAGLAAAASWTAVVATPETRQGTVVFIEGGAVARTPGGRIIVVDGGSQAARLLAELDRLLPLWDRRVDLYVASSWRTEHAAALNDVARRVPVDRVLGPPLPDDDRRWSAVLGERRLSFIEIDRPVDIALGDGSRLWVEPATPLAVRLALPAATVALNEAGRRRGAALGAAYDSARRPTVEVAGERYGLARHGAVRLVIGTELRVDVAQR